MATGHAFRANGATTWRARWDLSPDPSTGRRRQRSRGGFRTKSEAEAFAVSQTANVNLGVSVDPGRTTLGDYLEIWLAGIRGDLRPSTFNWYRSKVRCYITPALGARKLRDLTREEIRAFYATLPPPVADRVHRTLRRALYEATFSDLLPRNPAAGMRRNKPLRARGRGMRVWEWSQLQTFLSTAEAFRDPWPPYFRLVASTGCRRGEALGLFWSDVDLEAGKVTFQRGLADPGPALEETKTPASRRTVDLDPATLQSMRAWRKRQISWRLAAGEGWQQTVTLGSGEELANDLVFSRPTGRWVPPAKATQAFHRIREKAGCPHMRLHDLRHTHATLLLKACMNPKVVCERLGHESVGITLDLYGHVLPSMGKEAAALVARMLPPSEPAEQ